MAGSQAARASRVSHGTVVCGVPKTSPVLKQHGREPSSTGIPGVTWHSGLVEGLNNKIKVKSDVVNLSVKNAYCSYPALHIIL